MPSHSRSPRLLALAGVEIFVGLGALYGGGSLVMDPTGTAIGMPLTLLAGSPFADFLVPGLTLLLVNGVGSLVAAALALARVRWAGALGVALGAFLVAWILLQMLWIGAISWFQPVILACGVAEAWLGWRSHHGRGSLGTDEVLPQHHGGKSANR